MKVLSKLLALSIISAITLTTNSAFAQTTKTTTTKTTVKKAVAKPLHQTSEMMSIMNDNMMSARSLITMGNKIVTDGNTSGESEKMMMGAKMMEAGLEMLSHHLEHYKMNMKMPAKNRDMMNSMPISQDVLNMIKKMSSDSSMMLMKMGNKMVKDGNTNSNTQKMMAGGEMLENGMMIHHMGMMKPMHHDEMMPKK